MLVYDSTIVKEEWEERLEAEGGNGGKQPNFLQKLYEWVTMTCLGGILILVSPLTNSFLALDPHPCPEVIYWASDSKQLVIAQPDRVSYLSGSR